MRGDLPRFPRFTPEQGRAAYRQTPRPPGAVAFGDGGRIVPKFESGLYADEETDTTAITPSGEDRERYLKHIAGMIRLFGWIEAGGVHAGARACQARKAFGVSALSVRTAAKLNKKSPSAFLADLQRAKRDFAEAGFAELVPMPNRTPRPPANPHE